VFAGVLPEDKYKLVKAFQKSGTSLGCAVTARTMRLRSDKRRSHCGVDRHRRRQIRRRHGADEPGLAGIVAAVNEGRLIFQRILTYTLNSITKKIVQVLFLAAALVMTDNAILTPC